MKAKYAKGQMLVTDHAAGEVRKGETVQVTAVTKATKDAAWYRVQSTTSGLSAWFAETSLRMPFGEK